ncbi:MAG: peptide ABC transporter substrate-binding protein [Bdellovibrionales bacterium]|nr:peptide ABC transporter substrate-binding protein [Bdellovibrionales bacterium]
MRNLRFIMVFGLTLAVLAGTTSCTSKGRSKADPNTLYLELSADPATLNPITSSDFYASVVQGYIYSSLMERSEDTFDWIPALAEKYEISKDGKTFTFTIRDGVKWHDGHPLNAEDVKYSFDVFFEGRFDAPQQKVYLEGIKEAKVIDPRTVQFTTKQVYFKNFDVLAGLTIIPKHFYGSGDPKDPKFNKTLIGTGPYTLETWDKGQKILLKKNPNYFGANLPYFSDRYQIPRIFFRLVKEEAVALELLKKGDLDYMTLTPEQYVQKTQGPEWGTKVIAVQAQNSSPSNFSYGFIGWNFEHPFFKYRDVRMAMSHLVNRDFMIQKFNFDMSEKAVGPFGNKSSATSPKVKPVEFDPKKALELLQKNGWKMGPKGLAKKIEGKDTLFEFTLLNANPDYAKYWTVVKEDMKKIGITMNIKTVEWNSFLKLLDERKFEAVTLGWSNNTLEPDPKQIWHSASIPSPGSNFIGYSNPKVDKLIDEMRGTMDKNRRTEMLQQIHELIAADAPYSFMFNRKFTLYAHTARVKKKQELLKYDVGINTWTLEPPK